MGNSSSGGPDDHKAGHQAGQEPGNEIPQADRDHITADLAPLDALRPDLGQKLIRYVCLGDDDSILPTEYYRETEITATLQSLDQVPDWSPEGHWTPGRSDFLLAPEAWNPDVTRRYGMVLYHIYRRSWGYLPGRYVSPSWFRSLLLVYGNSRRAMLQTPSRTTLPVTKPWTIDWLKALLGDNQIAILDTAFDFDFRSVADQYNSPEAMPGFEQHLRADPTRRVAELSRMTADGRAAGLNTLTRLGLTLPDYLDFAIDEIGGTAKRPRAAAILLLQSAPPAMTASRILARFADLTPRQKVELVGVLAVCPDAEKRLRLIYETERNRRARAEIEHQLNLLATDRAFAPSRPDGPEGYTSLSGEWIAAPPPQPLPEDKPVTPALRQCILEAFAAWRVEDARYNLEKRNTKQFREREQLPESVVDDFCRLLDTPARELTETSFAPRGMDLFQLNHDVKKVAPVFLHPDLTLWQLLRGGIQRHKEKSWLQAAFWLTPIATAIHRRLRNAGGLRTLSAICVVLGDSEDECMRFFLTRHQFSLHPKHDLPDSLWYNFARHFAMIDEALGLTLPSGKDRLKESRALEMLTLFPQTPGRYRAALFERAIGKRKVSPQLARQLLAAAPELNEAISPFLGHPLADTRVEAAGWLAERQAKSALPALLSAAHEEREPMVRAALLTSMAQLGSDLAEFLTLAALRADAQEGLETAGANTPSWLPVGALPTIRSRNGKELEPDIIRWWILVAINIKDVSNPWIDLLLDRLNPDDAGRLGLTVLRAWIAYDTARPTDEEAHCYATRHIDATLAAVASPKPTREQVFAALLNSGPSKTGHSGIEQRGALALASRAPGADAVCLVKTFFHRHFDRTAQCKALLACLANNPSPLATQYVLDIANIPYPNTHEKQAAELIRRIAARRGLCADQIADRFVSTCGFAANGILTLPANDATWSAHLDDGGGITLQDPKGRSVSTLTTSKQGETATTLSEAKALGETTARIETAREDVKKVFDFQTRRLYEALCAQRQWTAAEWEEHLLHHPLVGHLVQRLIWCAIDGPGQQTVTFRPLADLSLADASGKALCLNPGAQIRLAHASSLSASEVAAWNAHLADHAVQPLFDQLNRPHFTLKPSLREEIGITDRSGWRIATHSLREVATGLGYEKGVESSNDWFSTFEKHFRSQQLVTIIEFTRSVPPKGSPVLTLIALRFSREANSFSYWRDAVPLKSVPPVLLSEAWNDFHAMAAAGTGPSDRLERKKRNSVKSSS